MKYAPIMIRTICRSTHFIRCIESLKRNAWAEYTDVYIGLDYPAKDEHWKGYNEILEYLTGGSFSEFKSFNVIKHPTNLGPVQNGISVRKILLEQHDRYITAEDDIEFAPCFLEFMDRALEQFENDPDVIGISGYSYPINWKRDLSATVMKQNFCASTWGIGFWKAKHEDINQYFNSGRLIDAFSYATSNRKNMIDAAWCDYIRGVTCLRPEKSLLTVPSDVALRIYLSVEKKYIVSPIVSKTRNMGFDGSGLYCQGIEQDVYGDFADNYNYSEQAIDKDELIDIILNSDEYLNENRIMLNKFDRRSKKDMLECELRKLAYLILGCRLYKQTIEFLRRET